MSIISPIIAGTPSNPIYIEDWGYHWRASRVNVPETPEHSEESSPCYSPCSPSYNPTSRSYGIDILAPTQPYEERHSSPYYSPTSPQNPDEWSIDLNDEFGSSNPWIARFSVKGKRM